jgi:hypothetical protein
LEVDSALKKHTVDSLINDFIETSKTHYQASHWSRDWKTANQQAKRLHKIFLQLVAIGIVAREALLALVEHEDDCVALMAAVYSLAHNPELALEALNRLSSKSGFIGFEAEQAIQRWREGNWKLE